MSASVNVFKSHRLHGIESLRAYAALAIVFFHLYGVGKVDVPEAIGFIKSHFGFGVPLFFVVSAFSMAYGYSEKLSSGDSVRNYFVRRLARIAPLFYFMLIFQVLHLRFAEGIRFSAVDIGVNALFAFNFVPHLVDGIVPASWSIGVEMIFYAAFPILALFVNNLLRSLLLCGVVTLVAVQYAVSMKAVQGINPAFVYHNFIVNFPYFCWGICGYYGYRWVDQIHSQKQRKLIAWAACLLGLGLMVMLYKNIAFYMFFWNYGLRSLWDSLWGMPFALLCIGMALHPIALLSNAVTRFLGTMSFSLYLAHPTLIYYLWKTGVYGEVASMFAGTWIAFVINAAITVGLLTAVSVLTFRYIELPGMALGKRFSFKPSSAKGSVAAA